MVEAEVTKFEEDHRIPIRRPRGSGCPRVSGGAGGNSFGTASFCRNYVQVVFFSRHLSVEGNLPTIRRPLRLGSLEWGNSQLLALGSIDSAFPDHAFRISDVCNPLAVSGEIEVLRRNSREVADEFLRFGIEAGELAAKLLAHGENLLAVFAR